MKHLFLLFLIYVSAFHSPLFAQSTPQNVKIGGSVTDENGNPIEFASIRLEGGLIGTVSNLKGRYSLKFESKDSVTVVFSMIGYQTRKRTLIRPQGNINLNITLLPMDYELGEVSVTGQRIRTGSIQDIKLDKTRLAPDASGGSVEAVIATQAGVSNNSELSTQYNVRGGSFDENMVYVNGMEVYRPLLIRAGEQEGLSFINPDMVESVKFSTGGYEARYGDKMSSVLDITYKLPTRTEGSVSLGLLGTSAYAGMKLANGITWTNSIRYKTNRYLLGTLDTKGEYAPRFIDYQTYINWKPSRLWEAGFIGNVSENQYRFTPEDRHTRFGTLTDMREFKVYFDGQERDLFRTFHGTAYIALQPNEQHNIRLQAATYHTRENETYDISGEYWLNALASSSSPTDGTQTGSSTSAGEGEIMGIGSYRTHARNNLSARVHSYSLSGSHRIAKHSLSWALEMKQEQITDRMNEWELRDSAGYSLPHTADGPKLHYVLRSNNRIKSSRYGFYVQDTYRFQSTSGLFTLTAGIRGGYWNRNGEFLLSPRASVGFVPAANERVSLRFATGVYHQTPFYKEFRQTVKEGNTYGITLNQGIRSQRAVHWVLGGDYNFRILNRPFSFSVEAYYKALSRLIPYNIDNVRIDYYGKNLSKGYATGLDMKLFGEFVQGTDSWLTFSVMKTEERLNGKWIPRPTDQRYRLSLHFTDYFPGSNKWQLTLKGTLAGGLPFGPPRGGLERAIFRTPPYRRVDIGISHCLIADDEQQQGNAFAATTAASAAELSGSADAPYGRNRQRKGMGNRLGIRSLWVGLDVFNLLAIKNINSYYWITDTADNQFAIPNYLTSRRINVRLVANF